jgi:hypothetical protein
MAMSTKYQKLPSTKLINMAALYQYRLTTSMFTGHVIGHIT